MMQLRRRLEFSEQQIAQADYYCKQVVEIMSHPACQLSNRFHLLRLPEPLLHTLALCDVAGNSDYETLARDNEGRDRGFEIDQRAVSVPCLELIERRRGLAPQT